MGSSALSARNLGKITVANNNEDGVAEAINKYILTWRIKVTKKQILNRTRDKYYNYFTNILQNR